RRVIPRPRIANDICKIDVTVHLIYLFIPSSHSPIPLFPNSLIHSFTHSLHSLIHSFTHSRFTHSPIHPFTHSPIHPFTHSPIHSFTHSLIHSLFTPPPPIRARIPWSRVFL